MGWRAPDFWFASADWRARLLKPLGDLYGSITARRMAKFGARVAAPVICVGNFTMGGAGKTPTAIALATRLASMNERPFVVTRGYGGRERGPLLVDPARHASADVGDEALEIVAHAPVVVARERVAGARMAIDKGATIILLDDGFQNPALRKDASLIVVDGDVWFGNGFCFPAGPLRAPLEAQLPQASAALVVGGDGRSHEALGALPVFAASIRPDGASVDALRDRRVLAFAGIGRPEKFFATLRASDVDVAQTFDYADHHAFSDAELAELSAASSAARLTPVTTVKDLSRIGAERAGRIFGGRLRTVPIALIFDNEPEMRGWLAQTVARARSFQS